MMNALKFLAVDRSLDSAKDVVGRFQMGGAGMLPVLGGRPSSDADDVSDRPKSGRSMWRRFVGWVSSEKAVADEVSSVRVEKQPELEPIQVAVAEPAVSEQKKSEGGGRFARFVGFGPFNRAEKKVVQAEFRFENVRVVCNELHDTDFIIKT